MERRERVYVDDKIDVNDDDDDDVGGPRLIRPSNLNVKNCNYVADRSATKFVFETSYCLCFVRFLASPPPPSVALPPFCLPPFAPLSTLFHRRFSILLSTGPPPVRGRANCKTSVESRDNGRPPRSVNPDERFVGVITFPPWPLSAITLLKKFIVRAGDRGSVPMTTAGPRLRFFLRYGGLDAFATTVFLCAAVLSR